MSPVNVSGVRRALAEADFDWDPRLFLKWVKRGDPIADLVECVRSSDRAMRYAAREVRP